MHRALCTWNSASDLGCWPGLAVPRAGRPTHRQTDSSGTADAHLADVVLENMLVYSRIHQILKAFLPSYWSQSTRGQMGVVRERGDAEGLAWKMLQGYCSRLTLHCSGIQFTWCHTIRYCLFHKIMYILYAAPLSWFVTLFSQANTAPGLWATSLTPRATLSAFMIIKKHIHNYF